MDAPTNENNDILILSFAGAGVELCFAHNSGLRVEEGFCEGRVGGKSFLESLGRIVQIVEILVAKC